VSSKTTVHVFIKSNDLALDLRLGVLAKPNADPRLFLQNNDINNINDDNNVTFRGLIRSL
jgi:hypothetical protein